MRLPAPYPELPVQQLAEAVAYYRDKLGFTVDWFDDVFSRAELSQHDCRLFMAAADEDGELVFEGPIVVWLELKSRAEIDELHERWRQNGARIMQPPELDHFKRYEFRVEDIDGNQLRIFRDLGAEEGAT